MGKEENTIEQELAKLMGLEDLVYTKEDRKTIARALLDLSVMGSGHLVMGKKGVKRLDPAHVKIKLD